MSLKRQPAGQFTAKIRHATLGDRTRKRTISTPLHLEPLEDRRLLAAGDLGSLAASGDDTAEFADANDTISADSVAVKQSPTSSKPGRRVKNSFSIDDVSQVEGNSGPATVEFTITRSGDIRNSASVVYQTANGSATAGSDYVAVGPEELTFGPHEDSKKVAITINGDTDLVEGDETAFVNLSDASGATISDGQGQLTIEDDDGNELISEFLAADVGRRGNKFDVRFSGKVEHDHRGLGVPNVDANGVTVVVTMTDPAFQPHEHDFLVQNFLTKTAEDGVFRTIRLRNVEAGEYDVAVTMLALDGFESNPAEFPSFTLTVGSLTGGTASSPLSTIASDDVFELLPGGLSVAEGVTDSSSQSAGEDAPVLEQQSRFVDGADSQFSIVDPDPSPGQRWGRFDWRQVELEDELFDLLAEDQSDQATSELTSRM